MLYAPFPFKQCSECGKYILFTPTHFPQYKSRGVRYLKSKCRECWNLQKRRYNANHPEQLQVKAEASKRYQDLHPERRREISRHYYATHKAQHAEVVRKYRECHREELKIYKRQQEQQRLSRKRQALSDFSLEDWQYCLLYWNNTCAYCGRPQGLRHKLAQDHFIPVAQNGPYTLSNIVPACHGKDGCNNSKKAKMPDEWCVKHFGKRKGRLILKRIYEYFDHVKLTNP